MNDLIAVEKIAQWQKLKALVLDSVSSAITKRVYNMALNEFMTWFQQAPRPGFTKASALGAYPGRNAAGPRILSPLRILNRQGRVTGRALPSRSVHGAGTVQRRAIRSSGGGHVITVLSVREKGGKCSAKSSTLSKEVRSAGDRSERLAITRVLKVRSASNS